MCIYTHMWIYLCSFPLQWCCLQESHIRGPTSIYARQTPGTAHHRHYMAGLSRSAPVRSTSKQKDNTSMFPPPGFLQSPTCVPGRTACLAHPISSDFQSSSWRWGFRASAAGPEGWSPAWGRLCGPSSGCLWRGHQATKKWPWLGLCLP